MALCRNSRFLTSRSEDDYNGLFSPNELAILYGVINYICDYVQEYLKSNKQPQVVGVRAIRVLICSSYQICFNHTQVYNFR